jgi:hypothetical protein
VSEIKVWRRRAFQLSLALVLLNPIYWVLATHLGGRFGVSDQVWGDFIIIGVFVGVISFVCGLIGQGRHQWALLFVSFGETVLWWFMAVGM